MEIIIPSYSPRSSNPPLHEAGSTDSRIRKRRGEALFVQEAHKDDHLTSDLLPKTLVTKQIDRLSTASSIR